jgi:hypothetical protein
MPLPVAWSITKIPYDISSSRLLIFINKKVVVPIRATTYAAIQIPLAGTPGHAGFTALVSPAIYPAMC